MSTQQIRDHVQFQHRHTHKSVWKGGLIGAQKLIFWPWAPKQVKPAMLIDLGYTNICESSSFIALFS